MLGTQVIWDPVNVSWVQDGQIIVQDASAAAAVAAAAATTTTTNANPRPVKDSQSILVQRRADDVSITNAVTDQNIGVITPGK